MPFDFSQFGDALMDVGNVLGGVHQAQTGRSNPVAPMIEQRERGRERDLDRKIREQMLGMEQQKMERQKQKDASDKSMKLLGAIMDSAEKGVMDGPAATAIFRRLVENDPDLKAVAGDELDKMTLNPKTKEVEYKDMEFEDGQLIIPGSTAVTRKGRYDAKGQWKEGKFIASSAGPSAAERQEQRAAQQQEQTEAREERRDVRQERSIAAGDVRQERALAAAAARQDVAQTQRDRQATSNLRKEFVSQSKAYQDNLLRQRRIEAAGKEQTPASDLSMIFAYMKMLDPESVVRESEFATAANARAVPDAIRNLYNRVMEGKRLTPEQRTDFMNQARAIRKRDSESHKQRESEYRRLAIASNLNPDDVIVQMESGESSGGAGGGERKSIGGKTYERRNGQWFKVR